MTRLRARGVVRRVAVCVGLLGAPSFVVVAPVDAGVAISASSGAHLPAGNYVVTTVGGAADDVRRDVGVEAGTVVLGADTFGGEFDAEDLTQLADDGRVANIVFNGTVSSGATQTTGPSGFIYPNDRIPWGLDRIDQRGGTFDGSYTYAQTGAGVTVYVVDSGVRASHAEFTGGRAVAGWDYRQNTTALNSYTASLVDPVTSQPTQPCGAAAESAAAADGGVTDTHGHGTHVAATIGGALAGIAKGATIKAVRALDCRGTGTYAMIAEALQWIVGDHASGPAIVNLSLGVSPTTQQPNPTSSAIQNQINALVAENVTVVVASGNSAADSCASMPARYSTVAGVIGVAANGWSDEEASYSNHGACNEIFAPGSDVLSASHLSDSAFVERSGTSMSAPHVVGAIALRLEAVPTATAAQVETWLVNSSTKCAITYATTRATPTPNRLLSIAADPWVPCAPTVGTATAGNKSVAVTWTAPTETNGSALTGFTVAASPGTRTCTAASGATTCTVTGLAAGQPYTFTVTAQNAVGSSGASSATSSATPTGAPDAPVLSSATPGLSSVTVAWSAALGTSNTYTVTTSPSGGSCVTSQTSCTITGLTGGQEYAVVATTTNAAGTSAASTALSFTAGGVPTAPTLGTTTTGLNSVTLTWTASTTATSYRVKNSAGAVVCTTTQTSCTVQGLAGGTEQSFTVESVNSYGASATAAVAALPDAQVGNVAGVSVAAGNASLRVSWTAATGNDVTYVATAQGTSSTCTTTATSCTLTGLANGRRYTVIVVAANKSSQSATAGASLGWPGFTVKAMRIARGRAALLTGFVVPLSTGKRTWTESGSCRITGRYFVAPKSAATCTLRLKVAKTSKFPATTVALSIIVQ